MPSRYVPWYVKSYYITHTPLHRRAVKRERERGVFIRINSQESPFVCVSAGGLAVLLLPSSFACVRA